jgi:hypothetical protein
MATMKSKTVGFNIESEEERLLLDHANKQTNFSEYVRQLMRQDIQRQKARIAPSQSQGIRIQL